MGLLMPFVWGLTAGTVGGFVAGLFTADEQDPHQQRIREFVRYVWEEAKRAAEEQEQILITEYERLTGVQEEDV